MLFEELPNELTHRFDETAEHIVPTSKWYMVNISGIEMMVDDEIGFKRFGDEWDTITKGVHPHVSVEEIKFTVH